MFRIRQRVLNTTVREKIYKRWSRLPWGWSLENSRSLQITELAKVPITMSEVTHELFIHHASWCPKIPWKKFMKTFSRCLDAVKRKTERKLIIFPCPHSPPYLFWRKIGTQSHSAKFLNWGDHVNLVPDLAASQSQPEQRTGNAEVTGSNPVEALIFFRLLLSNCLNWKIYCDDHSSLLIYFI